MWRIYAGLGIAHCLLLALASRVQSEISFSIPVALVGWSIMVVLIKRDEEENPWPR